MLFSSDVVFEPVPHFNSFFSNNVIILYHIYCYDYIMLHINGKCRFETTLQARSLSGQSFTYFCLCGCGECLIIALKVFSNVVPDWLGDLSKYL